MNNGADFFCILATTGETPTLTAEEKLKIKNLIVDRVQGRVPILMGCGGNNTAAIIEELKTGDFRGVDGILSVCPYYNKPSQEGLYQHFKAIAAATELPVVLYNVPGRTGVNMQAATTVRLARDCKNIVAIKEASGNLEQVDEIRKIHHRFTDLFSLLFVDGNPAGVKAMLSEMGFIENVLRLPLVPMQIKNRQRMSEILKELKI